MSVMEKFINTVMDPGSTQRYVDLINNDEVPSDISKALMNYTGTVFRAELENSYTEPISWIGLYIAAASLLCVFAMAADLLHGLRNRKLWFPCKYFTVNAAFLSVISAAMKLPMDISSSMPGNVDQVTKLGSMAFLCTMMANFLPSLATMNSKELLTNITGLGVMVITMVVNVGIQIQTGVVSCKEYDQLYNNVLQPHFSNEPPPALSDKHRNITIAAIYSTLLLLLLIIHICSSLAILKSKDIINEKYQKHREEDVSNDPPSDTKMFQKHVSKYWIMAGSPQFVTVSFVTTSACGVICVLSTALHIRTLFWTIGSVKDRDYKSDYQGSMLVILIIQLIGVILGTIVPLCRSFAVLCFEVSIESIKNRIKVFKVESYWIGKLYDWKRPRSIELPFRSHKWTVISKQLIIFFLKFCIAFQVAVVVTCKIISLIPLFMICTFYYLKCLRDKANVVVSSKMIKESPVELGKKNEDPEDIRPYVLKLQDETEISITTLKRISRSTRRLFRKGERQQPKHLLEFIKKSTGDKNINRDKEDCWSLLVVTLTTIAVSLPHIDKRKAEELLVSVKEGLVYVKHVEQSLKTTNECVSRQKAAGTLWHEFEVYKTWFGENMQEIASEKNTTREIVQLFQEKGRQEDMVKEGGRDDNSKCKSICAKSMYRITEMVKKVVRLLDNGSQDDDSECKSICATSMCNITDEILLSHAIDQFNQQQLFEHISQMISAILVDCLTNLPKVIAMKCHTSEIEKREATVQAAARLLGETTQIIETLQGRVPDHQRLNPNEDLPLTEKWGNTYKAIQDGLNLLFQELLFHVVGIPFTGLY